MTECIHDPCKLHLKVGQLVWWVQLGFTTATLIPAEVVEIEDYGVPIKDGEHRGHFIRYWIEPWGAKPEDVEKRQKAIDSGKGWVPEYRPGHACGLDEEIFMTREEAEEVKFNWESDWEKESIRPDEEHD